MEKQQILYIHGGNSYSNYNNYLEALRSKKIRNLPNIAPLKTWTGTFQQELGETFEVFMPSMPNSDNAKYNEWKIWFERHIEYLRDGLVLVGWSLGGMFLVKYLIENEFPLKIKALFLLAPPFEPFSEELEDCADFSFLWVKLPILNRKCEKVIIFHSMDDFVVPYEHALSYKRVIPEAEIVTFKDKNHFLIEKLPELLDKIRLVV